MVPDGLFWYFRATAFEIFFCSTILLHWSGIVKRKQKKRDSSKKKRMASQNHPLKLVSSVFICTLNGVDQTVTEPGVSGRVPFCSSGFQKARGGFTA